MKIDFRTLCDECINCDLFTPRGGIWVEYNNRINDLFCDNIRICKNAIDIWENYQKKGEE